MIGPRSLLRPARALAAGALSLLLLAGAAWAGEPTDQLRAGIDEVIRILRDTSLSGEEKKAERRALLRKAISRRFDFAEMARRALASQWKKRTPQERKEFVALFSLLMERSYLGKIELYTDEVIRYLKEVVDKDFARVKTVVVTKKKQEIPLYYRLHKAGDQWKVYDVIVEGVSLVNNYRQQFRAIIRKSSYADLVKKLRAKRDEG